MPAYLDRCMRLSDSCERLKTRLGLSVALNFLLLAALIRVMAS